MTRRWLILFSVLGHLMLGFGLFVAGIWNIERLPPGKHAAVSISTFMPPAAEGGGAIAARKVEIVKKRVTELVQPVPKLQIVPQAQTTTTETDPGLGSGHGSGSGDDPTGSGGCTTPPCGIDEPTPIPPPPPVVPVPAVAKPKILPPVMLDALFLSGDKQPHPSSGTANEMLRDNRMRVTGSFNVCIGEGGEVASVRMLLSTKYPAYDAVLSDAIHGWRYRPYLVDNRPASACANVTFIYAMH